MFGHEEISCKKKDKEGVEESSKRDKGWRRAKSDRAAKHRARLTSTHPCLKKSINKTAALSVSWYPPSGKSFSGPRSGGYIRH